jgi:DNA excision repair protein ERCC-4
MADLSHPIIEMNTAAPLPCLPALRSLADLADARPVIIVDTREQTPLTFTRLKSITGTLTTGDYSFAGGEESFAVERKSIPDLVACCTGTNRERFFRELHRLRGYRFKRLVVIGTVEEVQAGDYRSRITPAAVLATLQAIEARFDVPVVWADTPQAAALKIESWAYWFAREIVTSCNALARANQANSKTNLRHATAAPAPVTLGTSATAPNGAQTAQVETIDHAGVPLDGGTSKGYRP